MCAILRVVVVVVVSVFLGEISLVLGDSKETVRLSRNLVDLIPNECSSGCRDIDVEDFYCDSVCNNAACGYDGGDCVSQDSCYGFGSCEDCVSKPGCSFADDGDLKVGCASASLLNGFYSDATGTTNCNSLQSNPRDAESLNLNDDRLIFQRYYLDAIEVGSVWNRNITGKNILIHFCDTALDIEHAEFVGKYVYDEAGTSPDIDLSCSREQSSWNHGTAVAGYAAASANNSACGVGVAFDASVTMTGWAREYPGEPVTMFSKMLFTEWETQFGSGSTGVDIQSNSWGYDVCSKIPGIDSASTTCPFRDDNPYRSPCSLCPSNTNWELLSIDSDKECVKKIASYCTSGAGLDDAACQNYWDLFVECGTYTLSTETTLELQKGITCGRGGRGVIYTFAAGNEGLYGENVNFEGFLMSIYTISVASTGPTDERSYYSSIGTAVFVSAPGGDSSEWSSHMVTSVPGNECDNAGQGTSYACPIVSGVVALMLEANPNLTWRDVQEILAATSTQVDENDPDWITNAAGYHHSIKYGFGLVNASKAVDTALTFTSNSPSQALYAVESVQEDLTIPSDRNLTIPLNVTSSSFLESLEHVVLYVSASHANRGDISIEISGPSGTHSHVVWETATSSSEEEVEYRNFKVMTLQFWGESPSGVWNVVLRDNKDNDVHGTLNSVVLVLYGKCVDGSVSCRHVAGNLTAISENDFDVSEYETASINSSQWCERLKNQPISTSPKEINTDLICDISWMRCTHYCGHSTIYLVIFYVGTTISVCFCIFFSISCFIRCRRRWQKQNAGGGKDSGVEMLNDIS